MSLEGEIGEIAFSDVMQLCVQIKCTGTLVLRSIETGDVFGHFGFENGELFEARLRDLEGLDAVYGALELTSGAFSVDRGIRARERRIFASLETILLQGPRRFQESVAGVAAQSGGGTLRSISPRPPRDEDFQSLTPGPPPANHNRPQGASTMRSNSPARWFCPVCGQYFDRGGKCPDHGTELARARRLRTASTSTAAQEPALVAPGPGWRARLAWTALALAAVAVAVAAIPALRSRVPARTETRRPVATAAVQTAGSSTRATSGVAGVTDDEILFGMAAPFSGPAKELGRQMKLGIEAAFNAANDAGGIAGRRLHLIARDDGYEPARTVEAMKELRDHKKVFGFVGNVGTPTAAVALPLALEHKMLFFGAFTGANLLRHDPPDRYVFNFRASYAEETAAVVRYLIKIRHVRAENIAVFAQKDSFGDAGFAGVTKVLRELRPDIRSVFRVGYERNTTDVTDAVARLRAREVPVRAVVMVATYRAAARFVEKVRDLSPKMIFTNVSFVGSTALAEELKLLGPRYASGVIVTQVVPPVERFSTAILKYKDALGRYFPGEKLDYVSLEGYWVANVLIEGVRRVGRQLDTERLIEALESIHQLDLGLGTPLSFGMGEHQASHRVWGTQLNDLGNYDVIDLQ